MDIQYGWMTDSDGRIISPAQPNDPCLGRCPEDGCRGIQNRSSSPVGKRDRYPLICPRRGSFVCCWHLNKEGFSWVNATAVKQAPLMGAAKAVKVGADGGRTAWADLLSRRRRAFVFAPNADIGNRTNVGYRACRSRVRNVAAS